jgi:hypothetical protein
MTSGKRSGKDDGSGKEGVPQRFLSAKGVERKTASRVLFVFSGKTVKEN